jgi:hypothetical protein
MVPAGEPAAAAVALGTAAGSLLRGTVVGFDEAAGLGTVESPGLDALVFHCTAIADGSRRIEVGTEVDAVPGARHGGRVEAVRLAPRR